MIVLNQTGQGTYWRALRLGRALRRRGHNLTLLATSQNRRTGMAVTDQGGVTLVELPDLFKGSLRSGWDPWNTLNRIAWLRGKEFDLVHAFESRPTVIFPARSLAKVGVPLVIDWSDWFGRGGSVEERPNRLVRGVLRPVETYFEEHFRTQAAGTTVICSALHQKALALGVPESTILPLVNGADVERLLPIPVSEARRLVGLPKEVFILGYMGAIFRRDAELMARAFDLVCQQVPQARLVVAGNCPVNLSELI